MTLGIFAKTFVRPTVDGVFAAAVAAGFRSVQFNMACAGLASLPTSVDDSVVETIRRAARHNGVDIAAMSATFNMAHPDPRVRADGLASLSVLAGVARSLEIPTLTLCTGTRDPADMWNWHPENRDEAAWRDLVNTVTLATGIAETMDVVLAFEPEHANVVADARAARRLLDEVASERLKVVLDLSNIVEPSQPERQLPVLETALDLLAAEISIVHVKDLSSTGDPVALGRGLLDIDAYISAVAERDFSGPFIIHGIAESDAPESGRIAARALAATRCPPRTDV